MESWQAQYWYWYDTTMSGVFILEKHGDDLKQVVLIFKIKNQILLWNFWNIFEYVTVKIIETYFGHRYKVNIKLVLVW